jgi:hypothetical protein
MGVAVDVPTLLQMEGARVRVLNGSSVPGLAARTEEYLRSQGINVSESGNAEAATPTTSITFYTGKPYTLKYLVELMKINEFRIRHVFDPNAGADIAVIIGDDWALNNPMP